MLAWRLLNQTGVTLREHLVKDRKQAHLLTLNCYYRLTYPQITATVLH